MNYSSICNFIDVEINNKYMFVALNPSKSTDNFNSFHSGSIGDKRLKYISQKNKDIHNCYITDIIKFTDCSNSKIIKKKVINGEIKLDENFNVLRKEFEKIKPRIIVVFGSVTEFVFNEYISKNNLKVKAKDDFERAIINAKITTHFSFQCGSIRDKKVNCYKCYYNKVLKDINIKR